MRVGQVRTAPSASPCEAASTAGAWTTPRPAFANLDGKASSAINLSAGKSTLQQSQNYIGLE
jgi:hypothetical protein